MIPVSTSSLCVDSGDDDGVSIGSRGGRRGISGKKDESPRVASSSLRCSASRDGESNQLKGDYGHRFCNEKHHENFQRRFEWRGCTHLRHGVERECTVVLTRESLTVEYHDNEDENEKNRDHDEDGEESNDEVDDISDASHCHVATISSNATTSHGWTSAASLETAEKDDAISLYDGRCVSGGRSGESGVGLGPMMLFLHGRQRRKMQQTMDGEIQMQINENAEKEQFSLPGREERTYRHCGNDQFQSNGGVDMLKQEHHYQQHHQDNYQHNNGKENIPMVALAAHAARTRVEEHIGRAARKWDAIKRLEVYLTNRRNNSCSSSSLSFDSGRMGLKEDKQEKDIWYEDYSAEEREILLAIRENARRHLLLLPLNEDEEETGSSFSCDIHNCNSVEGDKTSENEGEESFSSCDEEVLHLREIEERAREYLSLLSSTEDDNDNSGNNDNGDGDGDGDETCDDGSSASGVVDDCWEDRGRGLGVFDKGTETGVVCPSNKNRNGISDSSVSFVLKDGEEETEENKKLKTVRKASTTTSSCSWQLSKLTEVYPRLDGMTDCALEIFGPVSLSGGEVMHEYDACSSTTEFKQQRDEDEWFRGSSPNCCSDGVGCIGPLSDMSMFLSFIPPHKALSPPPSRHRRRRRRHRHLGYGESSATSTMMDDDDDHEVSLEEVENRRIGFLSKLKAFAPHLNIDHCLAAMMTVTTITRGTSEEDNGKGPSIALADNGRHSYSQQQTPLLQNLTETWCRGEISNYAYLLRLNAASGRSVHDLGRYPIFPWVLSNYVSEKIDLDKEENYRDLSKPMGALDERRFKEVFLKKYRQQHRASMNFTATSSTSLSLASTEEDDAMEDDDSADVINGEKQEKGKGIATVTLSSSKPPPPFMYGSHYSSRGGVVLHYLIRLEPFASLHRQLQGGKFDVPDRLFHSIVKTWEQCSETSSSEVKELTPEWYSDSSFLSNSNHDFDFGNSAVDGRRINHVDLPPWANESAEQFVKIMRDALESDVCSKRLHHWIDLIFGWKQRGREAEKANNVFYHLTYYTIEDIRAMAPTTKLMREHCCTGLPSYSDDAGTAAEKAAKEAEMHIAEFGSCPEQLFAVPHPPKEKKNEKTDEMKLQLGRQHGLIKGKMNNEISPSGATINSHFRFGVSWTKAQKVSPLSVPAEQQRKEKGNLSAAAAKRIRWNAMMYGMTGGTVTGTSAAAKTKHKRCLIGGLIEQRSAGTNVHDSVVGDSFASARPNALSTSSASTPSASQDFTTTTDNNSNNDDRRTWEKRTNGHCLQNFSANETQLG